MGTTRKMNLTFTGNASIDSFTISWRDEEGNSGFLGGNNNNAGLTTGAVLGQSENVTWRLSVSGCTGTSTASYGKVISIIGCPFSENPAE